jgi:hypothetical protein
LRTASPAGTASEALAYSNDSSSSSDHCSRHSASSPGRRSSQARPSGSRRSHSRPGCTGARG